MGNALKALVIIAGSYSAAFATNVPLVFQLAYAITAIVVICFFWSRATVKALKIRRRPLELRTQVGKTIQEEFHLNNRSLLPNLGVEIHDRSTLPGHLVSQVFPLMARASSSWGVTTTCRMRGKFTLGPYSVATADPFGLFRWRRFVPEKWTVVVYPPTYALPRLEIKTGEVIGGQSLRQRFHFVTPSASGVREYAPGDSLNRIHWPSTARMRQLMTKEFEIDPTSDVWIALDLQREVQVGSGLESTDEYGVAVAASLAKHFLDLNRSVGVMAMGAHHTIIHADRGVRQLLKILEEMAVVRAEGEHPFVDVLVAESIRLGRNTTLFAISPSLDESWVTALKLAMHRGVRSVAVHLEARTYGEAPNSLHLIGSLAAGDIPAIVIKKGDNLTDALCLPN